MKGSLLKIQCDLRISPTIIPSDGIQIGWYFSKSGGDLVRVIDVSSFPPLVQLSRNNISHDLLSSSISFNGSLFQPSSHAGRYFCQPRLLDVTSPFSSSNMMVLASSYSDSRLCMDIQSQNTTRCAGNVKSSDGKSTAIIGEATEENLIPVTRQIGFKLREIENELHIGYYVLILVLVALLSLSFVILTFFLTQKCDRKKQSSNQGKCSSTVSL